ncbi:hypothetical protein QCA50_005480 [Cerrena zonata]|uniref:Uncharacterized protein n=1 Tax=Cerrena zonata TaxID=2478898 RepID=A0AAW0GLQ6_9APHY
MQCVDRPSTITTDIVTSNNAERCPTLQQISNLKPTQVEINTARTEWGQIKGHVLNGETGDPTSGRHLFSSWQAAHRGEQGICQRKTNLCSFLRTTKVHKTVWGDRARSVDFPGRYSTDQVADICIGAIILHGRNKGSNPFSVSMQTASNGPTNGKPICITHRTGASCFPDGIHPTLNQLGTPCASTGDAVTTDIYNVTL